MEIIREHLPSPNEALPCVRLRIDRLTLAKRRWRANAADGQEFGFDLDHHLSDGDVFFQTAAARYQIEQQPEAVLAIPLVSPESAARLGWKIGNLHFQIAITADIIHAPDDPAIRQLLDREGIAYRQTMAVFRPLQGSHSHGADTH